MYRSISMKSAYSGILHVAQWKYIVFFSIITCSGEGCGGVKYVFGGAYRHNKQGKGCRVVQAITL